MYAQCMIYKLSEGISNLALKFLTGQSTKGPRVESTVQNVIDVISLNFNVILLNTAGCSVCKTLKTKIKKHFIFQIIIIFLQQFILI